MIAWLSGLIYPAKCVFCGKLLSKEETDLCTACRIELPYVEQQTKRVPFSEASVAALYYEGVVRDSVLRYKFHGRQTYAAAYGRLVAMAVAQQALEVDLVTHVPVSRKRHRQRGYDQAERLSRAVAQELGLKWQRLLRKIRDNPAQSGISAPEHRRANVLGVYRVLHPEAVQGKRILIIDDVMTTGATLSECCRTLQDAGALQVSCAALACARRDRKQQVRT